MNNWLFENISVINWTIGVISVVILMILMLLASLRFNGAVVNISLTWIVCIFTFLYLTHQTSVQINYSYKDEDLYLYGFQGEDCKG